MGLEGAQKAEGEGGTSDPFYTHESDISKKHHVLARCKRRSSELTTLNQYNNN